MPSFYWIKTGLESFWSSVFCSSKKLACWISSFLRRRLLFDKSWMSVPSWFFMLQSQWMPSECIGSPLVLFTQLNQISNHPHPPSPFASSHTTPPPWLLEAFTHPTVGMRGQLAYQRLNSDLWIRCDYRFPPYWRLLSRMIRCDNPISTTLTSIITLRTMAI